MLATHQISEKMGQIVEKTKHIIVILAYKIKNMRRLTIIKSKNTLNVFATNVLLLIFEY